jgi:hypothetical protein
MRAKRLSKEKPAIRTSIFAFKVEKKIAPDRDLKDARALLGHQDLPVNLDLRALPGRLAPRADKFLAWIRPSPC